MFNKLKQLKDLRDQAKKMQNALSGETVTTEKNGIVITMDGNMQINGVKITAETDNKEVLAGAI
ncbi:MAG: YbaB/EbfC family nucleoid-associated protein [Patescibacteria group bacterium]